MRGSASCLLAFAAATVLTAPAAAQGAAGPALAGLVVPDGRVGVITGGVVPSVDGGPITVVTVIGNGTDAPVDARVAWAATDPAGELLWVGHPADDTWSNGVYEMYLGPQTLQPGGIGIALEQVRDVPADARYTFAVRTVETDPDPTVIALSDVSAKAGHLIGTVTNAGHQPFEISSTWLPVVALCFDVQGSPTSVHTTTLIGDGTALATGATMPFDIDLAGATCDRFLVVA